jgi:hypothetical protein
MYHDRQPAHQSLLQFLKKPSESSLGVPASLTHDVHYASCLMMMMIKKTMSFEVNIIIIVQRIQCANIIHILISRECSSYLIDVEMNFASRQESRYIEPIVHWFPYFTTRKALVICYVSFLLLCLTLYFLSIYPISLTRAPFIVSNKNAHHFLLKSDSSIKLAQTANLE